MASSGAHASVPSVVLFDLDGTLVDSAPDLRQAVNMLLDEEGRRPLSLAEVRSMIGDGIAALVERAVAATGRSAGSADLGNLVSRFVELYEPRSAELTRPYPGVDIGLERLRQAGLRLGLCTNKPQQVTETLLIDLGLAAHFDAVAGGDRFAACKPDPRHVAGLMELMGVRPGEAVMVGDSANDVLAGRAAGLRTIAVAWGYAQETVNGLGAELVAGHFDELVEILFGFCGGGGLGFPDRSAPASP